MTYHSLPCALYTAAETRELDRLAIEQEGIPGDILMTRAGEAAFLLLREQWPHARDIAVVCGSGNNGGDGYVVALLAANAGLHPTVFASTPVSALQGDALTMAERVQAEGVPIIEIAGASGADFSAVDVIVDGLLGTGLRGPVRPALVPVIASINQSGKPVLALDIPSGLSADSGAAPGEAVQAAHTITFIGVKRGLVTGEGPMLTGVLHFDDLRVPEAVYANVAPQCWRPSLAEFRQFMTPRLATAHKGQFGHVLVIGGDYGYAGAAVLSAQSAARCGAGLVTLATRKEHCALMITRQPEVMTRGIEKADDLLPLLEKATVVVIGPGLGQGPWGQALLNKVLASDLPRVLDADALNLIAADIEQKSFPKAPAEQVITPHPGEASRLLGAATGAVQQDRFAAAGRLQALAGGTVLLKGAGTLISSDAEMLALNTSGNPGMAAGGMGDVLSGVIGALLAQGLSAHNAARFGALLHGLAADQAAAQDGERGLLASDLLMPLRHLLNGCE
ncbi:MAG: NAD(P)H-hydrate dehydratase [Alcanivoracaceae bacterium]|nr:NAD(P)H-hydrate dehydratase [Alcanivoracaceae bacterium]